MKNKKQRHFVAAFIGVMMVASVLAVTPASAEVTELWSRSYDGGSADTAKGVATDASDNVIVTGRTLDGITWNYYTIKYDKDGNELWNRTFDRGYDDQAYSVATDASDNVIVTGWSDDGSGTIPHTGDDWYTIKYDKDGNELWNRTFDGGHWGWARGVATDASENVIVTGEFTDLISFNIHTIKYDKDGNELWNKTYDSGDSEYPSGVATDASGNVIVTGHSYDGSTINYFTIKYDKDGNELWNRTFDGGDWDMAWGVATDAYGNVIVTGRSRDGSRDNYYTIKYDKDGNELWNRSYDSGYDDYAHGVATDASDNVVVTGNSDDGSTLNYYTIKYDKDGNELWNKTYDSGYEDGAMAVATDASDNVIITGWARDGIVGEINENYYTIKYGAPTVVVPELCPDEYRWGSYNWDPYPNVFVGRQEVHFVNNGPGDAYNVTATVTCVPINVVATDPDVTLGDIPAGGGAWSTDTFGLRVDMTNPQGQNKGICWRVEYDDAAGVHHTIEDIAKYCGEECSDICP